MNRKNGHIYEFEEFRLIPAENLLLRKGDAISLKPKAFSTLVLLVERHGHLVEKSELMERIWEDSFVEEAAVSRCVWEIRNALGEDSKNAKFIQTVPKRGYRFTGEVVAKNGEEKSKLREINGLASRSASSGAHALSLTRSGAHSARLAVAAEQAKDTVVSFPDTDAAGDVATRVGFHPVVIPATPRRISPRAIAAVLAALAILSVVGGYLLLKPSQPVTESEFSKLAVLPLKPVNAQDRDHAIEFAIAESLILKISEAKNLNVKRLSVVRKFVELDEDPIDAGRELEVDYVLASNYQIADGRIRVTSQLLNVRTGEAEQTFKSEAESGNIFTMQDSVSNAIGNAVFASFGKPATTYTANRGTENEEAYSIYHEAMYLIDKLTAAESAKAVELLDRAIALDPNFAQAWAVKAHAICQFGHLGGGQPSTLMTSAGPVLEKALLLDPNNAIVYTVSGTINRDYHWNFAQAYKDLQRSIELDPGLAVSHRILAGLYYRDGKFAEAVAAQKRAVDLHPTSLPDKWFLGNYLVASGRVDEGIEQLNRVVEMNPSASFTYDSLWRIYHSRGDSPKAYEYFIKHKDVSGRAVGGIQSYKAAYEQSGWMGVLRHDLELRRSKDPKSEYSPSKYNIAVLAALVGEKDVAFEYLEEAFEFRLIGISFIKVDPLLDGLRSDPRYDDLIKRAGL